MARPELHSARRGNPVSGWFASRKERQRQAEEEAARAITDEIAKNETVLTDRLSSINFRHSRLPESVLTEKTDENQKVCDLEYMVRGMVQELNRQPQAIQVDIRPIDTELHKLAGMLAEAVDQGQTRAAYVAQSALVRGILDIRGKIPQDRPDLSKMFVEQNAKYLSEWGVVVEHARIADALEENVRRQREEYNEQLDKITRKRAEIKAKLQSEDPEFFPFQEAYEKMLKHSSPEERKNWGPLEHELFNDLVEDRLNEVVTDINHRLLTSHEQKLRDMVNKLETLHAKLIGVVIVYDPNLMNKYQEQLDELIRMLAESDQEVDETLKALDRLEGRLNQLDLAPGAVRAREVAADQGIKIVEELQKQQEAESAKAQEHNRAFHEKYNIKSEKEMEEYRKQAEQQRLKDERRLREKMKQSEKQKLYL